VLKDVSKVCENDGEVGIQRRARKGKSAQSEKCGPPLCRVSRGVFEYAEFVIRFVVVIVIVIVIAELRNCAASRHGMDKDYRVILLPRGA